jgi:hypothetical protein
VPSVGAASGASTCSSPPAPASPCWSLGGGKSGSVASALGAGSTGVDPSGADASRAGAAVIGPVLVDSSRVDDPGAGVVVAGFSWSFMALATLMKSSLSSYKSEKSRMFIMQPDANLQCRLLFDSLFHPQGLSRCFRCWRRGLTSRWRGPSHGDGDGCGGRWSCSHLFGLGPV